MTQSTDEKAYPEQVERLFAILHNTLKVDDRVNPLDHLVVPFPLELMNPNPSSRRTKDGPKYMVTFEVSPDAHEYFMSAKESAGLVISGVMRVEGINTPQKKISPRPIKTVEERVMGSEAKIAAVREDVAAIDRLLRAYPSAKMMAVEWCGSPLFWEWLKDIGRIDGSRDYKDAAETAVREMAGCDSRNELDVDATKRAAFFSKIAAPFSDWLKARRRAS